MQHRLDSWDHLVSLQRFQRSLNFPRISTQCTNKSDRASTVNSSLSLDIPVEAAWRRIRNDWHINTVWTPPGKLHALIYHGTKKKPSHLLRDVSPWGYNRAPSRQQFTTWITCCLTNLFQRHQRWRCVTWHMAISQKKDWTLSLLSHLIFFSTT